MKNLPRAWILAFEVVETVSIALVMALTAVCLFSKEVSALGAAKTLVLKARAERRLVENFILKSDVL